MRHTYVHNLKSVQNLNVRLDIQNKAQVSLTDKKEIIFIFVPLIKRDDKNWAHENKGDISRRRILERFDRFDWLIFGTEKWLWKSENLIQGIPT